MAIMPNTSRGHCKPPVISVTLTEKICMVVWWTVKRGIGLSVKHMAGIDAACTGDSDSVKEHNWQEQINIIQSTIVVRF